MNPDGILKNAAQYYTEKLKTFGPTFKGVDWPSSESQEMRFEQLLKVCDFTIHFSLNDYGCGYGGLLNYLMKKSSDFQYVGYDISKKMIVTARELWGEHQNGSFINEEQRLKPADYTIASGIFNVKQSENYTEWGEYVLAVLNKLDSLSEKGFSFNILTQYSDKEFMRDYLYYADPCFYFDYCKNRFSRNVSLLHDYDLYEFSIIVRK